MLNIVPSGKRAELTRKYQFCLFQFELIYLHLALKVVKLVGIFLCRDQMGVVEVKVSSGQLDVSKEKNLLVWALGMCFIIHQPFIQHLENQLKKKHSSLYTGQKFPKTREVTMEGKILFSGPEPGPSEPLCTGLTAYIKVLLFQNKKKLLSFLSLTDGNLI